MLSGDFFSKKKKKNLTGMIPAQRQGMSKFRNYLQSWFVQEGCLAVKKGVVVVKK